MGQAQRKGVRSLRKAVGKRRGHGAALSLLSVGLKVLAWVSAAVAALTRHTNRERTTSGNVYALPVRGVGTLGGIKNPVQPASILVD